MLESIILLISGAYGDSPESELTVRLKRFLLLFPIMAASILSAFLGIYSMSIILAMLVAAFLLSGKLNVLYFYLIAMPFIGYYFSQFAIWFGYLFAFSIIFYWTFTKLTYSGQSKGTSGILLMLILSLLFFSLTSIFVNGVAKNEVMTLFRFLVLFIVVFAIYDLVDIKDSRAIFAFYSIPMLYSTYLILDPFLNAGSALNLLHIYRMKVAGLFENANATGFLYLLVTPFWISG
jgi:hypothetical protein